MFKWLSCITLAFSHRINEFPLKIKLTIPRLTAKRPTHQNNTTTSTRDNSTTMSSIEAVIAAIESLESGEQFSYRKIAEEYGCSYTTLRRRHQGISTSRATRYENQQALNPHKKQSSYGILNASQGEVYTYTSYDTEFRLTDREERA